MTAPARSGRAGLRHRQGRPDLRAVRELGLPALAARRLGGGPGARPAAAPCSWAASSSWRGTSAWPFRRSTTFYLGLVLIAVGTGLLKANVSVLVGKLYAPDDVRRDAGYSHLLHGHQHRRVHRAADHRLAGAERRLPRACWRRWDSSRRRSWHWGFGAAAVGMFCGLVQYVAGREAPVAGRAAPGPAERPGRRPPGSTARSGWSGWSRGGDRCSWLVLVATGAAAASIRRRSRGNFKWVLIAITVAFFAWLFLEPASGRRRSGSGWW